ncbi:hypothetical protein QQF64_010608 [Cirrhinus molitorella]|uniref:Adhesion G-protein coupled receptor G2-like n=2 Tax=Cirrhinus molitorella TaxID=172907 RepID=A0ABR3LZZ6_9TELE
MTSHNPTTSFTSHVTTNGYTDPSKASVALDSLESKMEEMKQSNKSNQAIVTEDAVGLLHVQAKNTETKDINICYFSNNAMVVESQTDLNTNCSWSVKISKEAFDKSRLENNGSAFVGVLRFKNIVNKDETNIHTVLNNEVYGITMRAKISNLTENIDMVFSHNDTDGNLSCVSWDGKGRLNWTTFGCKSEINNNSIKCSCSHLTFFAVLMTLNSQTKENTASHLDPELTTTNGYTDPSKASVALDSLESKMEEMKQSNKSNQAIVTEDAVGLLHVQAKNTETKDINICYFSNNAMVVESQTDLNTNCSWSVKISKEAFDKSRLENNGSAFVGVLRFKNIVNKDETNIHTVLNNEVYGITMRAKISNLTENIDMVFSHNDTDGNLSCVSWDGKGRLNWTTFGCRTEINNNSIKCSCSHLTFFAVLMTLNSQTNENTALHLESLTLISSVGCGISTFFMAIALFMHFLLRKATSNQATKILMNMFVALCLLNASFLSNESIANAQDNGACVFIALVLHYSMLASFTWFFIQALHMYLWLIRQNITITNYMRKITVLGWACPAPIVIFIVSAEEYKAVTLNATSGKVIRMCWITNPYIYYIVNIGYYALVFIFTTGIFIMIATRIVEARNIKASEGKRKTFRKQLMMVLGLFLLFGLTWSVAFFSYGPMLIPSYYIFTVLNSFQGFFLFLYYYHIHDDIAGIFSDDPEGIDFNSSVA